MSLDLPTQEVEHSAERSFHLVYDQTLPVENWNAQISLLTGIAASRIMLDGGDGLLRTLPEPDPRTVGRLRRTAHALGIDWDYNITYADKVRDFFFNATATAEIYSLSLRDGLPSCVHGDAAAAGAGW